MVGSKRVKVFLVPFAVAVIVAAAFLSGAMDGIERLTLDLRLRTFGGGPPAPVAFVTIDSETIRNLGRWPIARGLYAQVLERIQDAGARAVLMDIDFSSIGPDPEEDRALARSVRGREDIVLAVQLEERVAQGEVLVRSVSMPIAGLLNPPPALGSITFKVCPDGVVRRLPEPINFIDEIYHPMGIVGARILDPQIPLEYPFGALINMSLENLQSIPVVPFSRVLEGDFDPDLFRNRIVIIGATTTELHDFWLTPIGIVPGIYLQAAVMETVLNQSWYLQPGIMTTVAAIILVSFLLGQFLGRCGWFVGLLYLSGYLVLLVISAILFAYGHRMISLFPLATVALLQYPIHLTVRSRGVEKDLAQTREKTEALLKLSELKAVEKTGSDGYLVPLVLLRQILGLERVQLLRHDNFANPPWKVETVFGEEPDGGNADLPDLVEIMERREILNIPDEPRGTARVFLPMMTARSVHGVLSVEGPLDTLKDQENMRLLLSYATQASYFLEMWELDQRVKSLYTNTVKAITKALDSRDYYTSAHSELSLEYVEKLGKACGLDKVQIEALHIGTLLHDIGKIGTPDRVLNKKGRLTEQEFEIIKEHPSKGFEIIRDLPFPTDVRMIVLHHHERFDGSGYPDGLKGNQIPFLVRIFSILDTYEALIGRRPYKDPLPPEKARSVLLESSGSQFDPQILKTFLSLFQ